MELLGIDVGGTGIKGGIVDSDKGKMVGERFRLDTPRPATPESVTDTVAQVVKHFNWKSSVGAGFPAVVRHAVVHTAANIDQSWIGCDVNSMFAGATGCSFSVRNDADVAGMAEMRYGAGRNCDGVVLVLTLGTGIGSSLFTDGKLVPNTEFGHIEISGRPAERRTADSVRTRKKLSWKKWAERVDDYLHRLDFYLWPDLIIIGGGVSRKHERFLPLLTVTTKIVPAMLRNDAGIIGAACASIGESEQSNH